jgi:hypothetical protein
MVQQDKQDKRFELVNTFTLTVPESYNHATQLASFRKRCLNDFFSFDEERQQESCFYDDGVSDANCSKTTHRLVAGKTYTVRVFVITESIVRSEDCLKFLHSQRALLVSAQGLSLVWQQKKDELPVLVSILSFDEEEAVVDAAGAYWVPLVLRCSEHEAEFGCDLFSTVWDEKYCLLCFCDEMQ